MLNGSVVVTAKEGALQVEDHGATKKVTKGQTIVLTPKTADKRVGRAAVVAATLVLKSQRLALAVSPQFWRA